jgi:amino-acid N-acetyltransferase
MVVEPLATASLDAARALLAAAELPTDDLEDPAITLLGVHAGAELVGVIGLQACGDGVGLLRSLAVAPAHQGRGLAARLCDAVVDLAAAGAVRELYLLTTTAADYFARRGFTAIDRAAAPEPVRASAQFASLCPASARVMRYRDGYSVSR